MNPFWLSGPGWAALVNALLNTLWQGAFASAALLAALRLVPAKRPGLRYGLSAAALAGVVLAGVGGWAWRVAPEDHAAPPVVVTQASRGADPAPAFHQTPAADAAMPAPGIVWARWAGCAWLAGVAVCLVRAARGVIGAGRLRRGCRELADPRLLALAAEIRAKLRISRPVQILVSAQIKMPSVMGVFGAAILIPAEMLTGISAEQWTAILAHELAHVRRWDYLVNLGQMLVEALLFFNPFVWWISRQMRLEREACCDQVAAALCQSPARYVAALVSVIEHRQALLSPVLAAGGESGRDALDRARRLLAPGYTPALRLRWFSFAGVCALGILALSALGIGARAVAEALTPQERIAQIARLQASYAPPVYPDGKIQIKGIVHQEGGAPLIERATLYVYSSRPGSGDIAAFDINPAGTFSVSTECGEIRLAVYADGWAPAFLGPFDTNKGQPANLDIPMQRGFAGNIRTVDEAGQPVAGVRLSWTYPGMAGAPSHQETISDAAGQATLPHAAAFPLNMRAWANGYQADEVQAVRLDPAKPYTWTLRKAQPMHGQITSAATGAPIAGASIKLAGIFGRTQMVYGIPADAPLLGASDARGGFTIDTLPEGGNCWLYVEAAGYGNVILKSVQPTPETLRIALGPELTVSGTVIHLQAGETTLWYNQTFKIGNCSYSLRQTSVALKPDESGKANFHLGQLYPAPLTITAGRLADPQIVKIEPEDLPKSGLRIDLAAGEAKAAPPARTREVVVHFKTPEGSPSASGSIQVLSGGPITLPLDHGRKSIPSGQPEVPVENGVAKFEAQTPTTLILGQSRLIGYSLNMPAAIEVPNGEGPRTIEVAVQPAGAIYGEAVEADGSPGAGLLIFARTFKHPHDPGFFVALNDLTSLGAGIAFKHPHDPGNFVGADIKNQSWGPNDLQNQFVATGLTFGGEYVIQVQRDDLNVSSEPVRIDASNPIQHVKLVVPAGHPLTVHLTDENGAPAAGIAFRLRYLASPDNRSDGPIHWSDSEGLCTIPSVNLEVLDRYSVRVESRSRYQPAMTPCAPGQSSVEVHLKTGKTLTGTVVDAVSFRPVAGVDVYAWSAGDPSKPGTPAFAILEAEAPTDERGSFQFSDLPDSDVYLNTRQVNLADPRKRPTAKPGQAGPVQLQVKVPPGSEARIVTPGIPEVAP